MTNQGGCPCIPHGCLGRVQFLHVCYYTGQSQSVRSTERLRACFGRGYSYKSIVYSSVQWRCSPSEKRHRILEVESRTTRTRRNSSNGEFCVARQRPVRRFAALAWRHVQCDVGQLTANGRLYKVYGNIAFVVLREVGIKWRHLRTFWKQVQQIDTKSN